ncbi:hypothetical protein D3C80_2172220 [compost metagenome]
MNTQLETFDDLEKDFIKNYNITNPLEDIEEKEVAVDLNLNDEDEEEISNDLDQIKSFFANK